jgi:hypothetical protein
MLYILIQINEGIAKLVTLMVESHLNKAMIGLKNKEEELSFFVTLEEFLISKSFYKRFSFSILRMQVLEMLLLMNKQKTY